MLELNVNLRRGAFQLSVDVTCNGRVTGVFGPSGSGKTTLLDVIAGLATPDAGRVAIDDTVLFDSAAGVCVPARGRRMGYVFQDALLFPHLSVRENLLYGRREGAGPGLDDVADWLEIRPLLDQLPRAISGGEQRRVSIGRALLSNPRLLLLDEPLTGLDAALAARVAAGLRRIPARCGVPALIVSHSISDILFLCDEAVVMRGGRVIRQGPPREVLLHADTLTDGSHWSGLRNVFSARLSVAHAGGETPRAVCRVGHIELDVFTGEYDDRDVVLSIPAADIVLSRGRPVGLSARNIFPGRVTGIVASGVRRLIEIDAGAPWLVEISAAAVTELALAPGVDVHLILKTSSIAVS